MSKLQRWPESNPALHRRAKWVTVTRQGIVWADRLDVARPKFEHKYGFWSLAAKHLEVSQRLGQAKNIAACHSSLWRVHWRKGVAWLELTEEHQ